MSGRQTVQRVLYPDDESTYVAECRELHAVTQGETLDEVVANLQEGVALALDGKDLARLGLDRHPSSLLWCAIPTFVDRTCSPSRR